MKTSTKIVTAVVLSVGVAGGAAAFGKHRYGSPEVRAERIAEYVSEELELDTSQAQALDVLKDQMLSTASSLRSELSPVKDEIRQLLAAETFDQARALELINAKASAMTTAAPELLGAMGNFLDGLNAEQKAEIQAFMQHRAEQGQGHRRHGWK